MPKYIFIILLIIVLIIAIFNFFIKKPEFNTTVKINFNTTEYTLEIAKTISQKSTGLSNRPNLCPNCGMIFVFNNNGIQPFWMKDTLIPLDMIWVNSQGKIVSIETAHPEPDTPITQLKIYKNSEPAKYVIELNAGDIDKLNLKVGDFVNLSILNE